jgi:hypothetical protein
VIRPCAWRSAWLASSAWSRCGQLVLASLLLGRAVLAQEPPPPDQPPAALPPEISEETHRSRPGRFRIGPLYLTPTLRVRTIGFDTNVFYTATNRRADFMALGGPGLDAVLPVRRSLRLSGGGDVTYLYFVRTPSQRRLTGSARGQLDWGSLRSGLTLSARHETEMRRPDLELDRRVLTRTETQRVDVWRQIFGRTTLRLKGERMRRELDEGEVHLGVDLRRALSQDRYLAGGEIAYGLTVKTSIVLVAERASYRMLFDDRRDVVVDHVMGGLRTDESALISGRALVGQAWVRPGDRSFGIERLVAADVDATLNLSRRTRFGGIYSRDTGHSALAAPGAAFMLTTERYGLRLDKDLVGDFNLELFARRSRLSGAGRVVVTLPDGTVADGLRRDTADELGGDLGYRFRSRLRIGCAVSYVERRSTISYFGIDGLLVGLTVRYAP